MRSRQVQQVEFTQRTHNSRPATPAGASPRVRESMWRRLWRRWVK